MKAFILLIILLVGQPYLHQIQAQTRQQLQKTIDSLKLVTQQQKQLIKVRKNTNKKLLEKIVLMKYQLETSNQQRDSIQKLLNNSRHCERRYRIAAIRLKKLLEDNRDKIDSLQKAYDEISTGSGSTLAEYRKQIMELTTERNNLESQNQRLQARLKQTKGSDQQALFVLTISAQPGIFERKKFKPSSHAILASQIQVSFSLSRPTTPNEQVTVKLFDVNNKEISLKPSDRNNIGKPTPANQLLIVEPAIDAKRKFSRGNYAIRLFLTNVNQGINNQSIGIAEFSLR